MARFIAIPVAIGDSFYLERDGFSVLVDGGKSINGFPQLFSKQVKKQRADIVVCTHNDADHANGIIGFLEAGFKCKELWLPGMWLDCVNDLMEPDRDVIINIVNGAEKFWLSDKPFNEDATFSFEEIGERLWNDFNVNNLDKGSQTKREAQNFKQNEFDKDWTNKMEKNIDTDSYYQLGIHHYYRKFDPLFDYYWNLNFRNVVEKAIEAGDRIKQIAILAYTNGIPIRWLNHDPHNPSGKVFKYLHILSARQSFMPIDPADPSLLFFKLALTTVNKESLVLYSPADEKSPGVLFCADSDLKDINLPIQKNDLITVPHHGSEANKKAYENITTSLPSNHGTLVWVRSDFPFKSRPGSTYKNLKGDKFCTICSPEELKQAVKINGESNLWRRQARVRKCNC